MSNRPNILLILSDQHCRKIAGCYGDATAVTPNIDRIAGQGVVFDAAYCPSPICTPSRMSMLTGRWPHEQRCWTLEDQLAEDIPTYAHSLGAAGYRTILCGRLHAIGPDQMHGYGERHVGDCSPNWLGAPRQDLGPLAGSQGPAAPALANAYPSAVAIQRSGAGQSGYEVVDDAATDAACDRLAQLGKSRAAGDDTPFLLSVGYVLPHCPFVARRADYEAFEGRVGPAGLPRTDNEHPWISDWRRHSGTEAPDPAAIIRARTAYYGLVRALDAKIGRLLQALEAAGLAENTLIIYTSDHGEQLGERDLWWKNTFYEESVAVPLLLSWPGHLGGGARRSPHIANLVDVGATMIAAAGAKPLARSRGRSLLSIAAGDRPPWVDETFSEYVTGTGAWTGPRPTQQRMLRSGRWKLVYIHGHRPQLFDLHADPWEARDLGDDPDYAEVRAWLTDRVLAGWDPEAIARAVRHRSEEQALLAAWGRRTKPESQHQFMIASSDNWLD